MLVDQIPAKLVASFDRLRADGIDIDIARDARDAADRIHPEERLLVLADGIVPDRALVARLAGAREATLMTLPESADAQAFERIDTLDRWAGMALVDGQRLRETVAMLGDWTLAPTLLRSALQSGAVRMRVPDASVLGKAGNDAEALALSRRLVDAAAMVGEGVFSRHVAAPLAKRALPAVLARHVPLDLIGVLPLVFAATALLLVAMGWTATGAGLFLTAALPHSAGSAMAAMAARASTPLRLFERGRLAVFAAMLAAIGWTQFAGGEGWGSLVLALWTICALFLGTKPRRWFAEAETGALILFGAALAGTPLIGIGLIVAAQVANEAMSRERGQ